jgi:hypothetical protein
MLLCYALCIMLLAGGCVVWMTLNYTLCEKQANQGWRF